MTLQADSRVLKVQSGEEIQLFWRGLAESGVGMRTDGGTVLLDATQQLERGLRAGGAAVGLEARAHHAIENERQEADQGVSSDEIGKAVIDGGDLQIALEHPEAALDVGEILVAGHDLIGAEVGDVCEQHQFAVEALGACDGVLGHAVAEPLGLVVGLDEARQLGLGERTLEPAVGTPIGGATAALGETSVLGIELGDQLLGQGLESPDPLPPLGRLFGGPHRIVGDHQTLVGEVSFG